MFKSIALTAALSLTTMTAAHAGNPMIDQCDILGDITQIVAEGRDEGVTPIKALDILLNAGIGEELAALIVKTVYITMLDDDPVHVGNVVALGCVQGLE